MKRFLTATLIGVLAAGAYAQWPTFHGNAQRSGASTVMGPTSPVLKWSLDLGGPIIGSPIVGSDGVIYTGSVWSETRKPKTFINAIRPDGTFKWRYELPFIDHQTISTPTLGPDGSLYVGCPDGRFLALDANGTLKWSYQAETPIESHAVVSPEGRIYVYLDSKLTRFDANGNLVWQFELGFSRVGGPTLALDGTIYAVASDGVIAVRPDGTLKWRSTVTGGSAPVAVSPNGDVIVGGAWLSALDPTDGSIKWYVNHGWSVTNFGSPAIDPQGNVYYTAYIYVWKISPIGQPLWEQTLQDGNRLGQSYSSILVDGRGNLIFGMGSGKRWAIPLEKKLFIWNASGQTIGSYLFPEATAASAPAIGSDGTLYIGCLDGRLYALKQGP